MGAVKGVDLTPVPTTPATRNFGCAVEAIRTPCRRVVERKAEVVNIKGHRCTLHLTSPRYPACTGCREPEQSISRDNTYRLWEAQIDGARYETTRTAPTGQVWGLAHTRRPAERLTDQRAAVEWEMQQEKRAVDVIVATCPELEGGVSEGVFRTCGTVRLLGNPAIRHEQALRARREAKRRNT